MGFSNQAGLNINNFYGPRDTGGSVGVERSQDSIHQMSFAFTGDSLNSTYLPPVVVPKGAQIKRVILRVDEAFVLTGTAPTVSFGSAGSEAANGITLTQAELQAVGTKTPASSGAGTWSTASATGLLAASKVGRALGGTTPAVATGVGKATLVVEYFNKTKV